MPVWQAEMARVREARLRRAERIVDLMRADGVDVTWEEVQGYAAGGTVGRPHLAQALIRRGLAATVSEAFAPDDAGRSGGGCRRRTPTCSPRSRSCCAAGGVPVFAHPRATVRGRVVPDELIVEMAGAGLFGLEADHADHTPEQREQVRALATDLGLVVTGSSDFHGANKTVALGAHLTAPEAYEKIRAAARDAPRKRVSGPWT